MQAVIVSSKFKISSISKIAIQEFQKMPYAFIQGKRIDNSEFMFSEADFLRRNQVDVISLIIWLKQRASTNQAYTDAIERLREYVLDMIVDFSVDWEIGQTGEKEANEPDLDLNVEIELPRNILKKPHIGVVFSSKG
ncbi:unnamed protein product [Lactuca virosa]|uniref:Uncharacterized protein n=1 Tax=Lactuca virosa TaxID=75947 RepID=A0AAU9MGL1_9ASTR|nr:unnamed protein product [Lactuca virosa]